MKTHKRVEKLWHLTAPKLNGMIITSPENVRYLSGFSGTEGMLLLTRKEGFFLTDGRYTTQAQEQVKGFTIITFKEKWKEAGRIIKKLGVASLGFESRNITVAAFRDFEKECMSIELLPQAEGFDNLRAVKDADEIRILKKAACIAAESLRVAVALIRPGIREMDIAVELEYQMRKRGGAASAFQTIIASGYRSALPHGVASQKKIKRGEFLTIDYGTLYKGYCSDETCTFVIGEPTKKQKRIYETVKKAHDLALRTCAPGKDFKVIDAAARKYIARQGYARYFNHGTGHGIGLCVHEPPTISFRSKARAQKGMVFTIEPGIYIPCWGGVRIEDTVVVISQGCEVITKTDKNLQCVGI